MSKTIYVNIKATNGANNGSKWKDAYIDLQRALKNSTLVEGDAIWVAQGMYTPGTKRINSFALKKGIKIYGGFAGTEDALAKRNLSTNITTLSGAIGTSGNCYHVVTATGDSNGTELDGFTITGGNADGGGGNGLGGGLYCHNSSSGPLLSNITFSGNKASKGGAVYNNGSNGTCSPQFTNVQFLQNEATSVGGAVYNDGSSQGSCTPTFNGGKYTKNKAKSGGAIYNWGGNKGSCTPEFTNVDFSNNNATNDGGAVYNDGGKGICSPKFTNGTFSTNKATKGGAIYNWGPKDSTISPTFKNVEFSGNEAASVGGAIYNDGSSQGSCTPTFNGGNCTKNKAKSGGAIYNWGGNKGSCTPEFTNVEFSENEATNNGGAIYNDGSSQGSCTPKLNGGKFSKNKASSGGAIYNWGSDKGKSNPTFKNVDFSENEAKSTSGGAIYNNGSNEGISSPTFTGGKYTKNKAKWGGAIYNNGANNGESSPSFTDVEFSENEATSNGGGVYNDGSSKGKSQSIFIRGKFFKNMASFNGGAIYNWGSNDGLSSPSFTDVEFSENVATSKSGGAIYNDGSNKGSSSPTLTGGKFAKNKAKWGGAIYNIGTKSGRSSPSFTNVEFNDNEATSNGGGIYNEGSKYGNCYPILTKCKFLKNTAVNGGAIYNWASYNGKSNPTFTDVEFSENEASNYGGAVCNDGSKNGKCNPTITGGKFNKNKGKYGGAVLNDGTYMGESNPEFTNVEFSENEAINGGNGGAIHNYGAYSGKSNSTFTKCKFNKNKAGYGGAFANYSEPSGTSSPKLSFVTITGNKATNNGGAIYNYGAFVGNSSPELTNVTISGNQADTGGGIYNEGTNNGTASPQLTNVILWNNGANEIFNQSATPIITNSIIKGNTEGQILSDDPLFVTPIEPSSAPTSGGDFSLKINSPALNAGKASLDIGAHQSKNLLYVNHTNSSPTQDGSSWEKAFNNLQSAIEKATVGTKIWVAKGTYTPTKPIVATDTDARKVTFALKEGVAVYGGFIGNEEALTDRDWEKNITTLNGKLDATSKCYHVVTGKELSSATVFDGFTISSGNADGDKAWGKGGGLYCDGIGQDKKCSPTLNNLVISNNSAAYGGGMANDGSNHGECSPKLTNITFSNNNAATDGGAIVNDGSDNGKSNPTLNKVKFSANSAENRGGAMVNIGSNNGQSNPTLTNIEFSDNEAKGNGGAIVNDGSENGTTNSPLINVTFSRNFSKSDGGAISNEGNNVGNCDLKLTKVKFLKNKANASGGAISNSGKTNLILANSTFSDNSSSYGGAIADSGIFTLQITNATFTNNKAASHGGAIYSMITSNNCTIDLSDVHFSRNNGGQYGGAFSILVFGNVESSPNMTNVSFTSNKTATSGGAIFSRTMIGKFNPTIINGLFSGNTSQLGGGLFTQCDASGSSNPTLTNVTFTGNKAVQQGGALYNFGGVNLRDSKNCSPTLTNVILWNNSAEANGGSQIYNRNASPIISYSIIEGGINGNGIQDENKSTLQNKGSNLNLDPLFILPVDPANAPTATGNLRLGANSPAIGKGNLDVINNVDVDFDGKSRKREGKVDIGAYEGVVVFVNHAVSGGTKKGSNWANAYTDLPSALEIAQAGDEIWVAKGTYTPQKGSERNASFVLRDKVQLYGGFKGDETQRDQRDWKQNVTKLSGDSGASGEKRGILTGSKLTPKTTVDGFTITSEYVTDDASKNYTAGFSCTTTGDDIQCNPTLRNLTFSDRFVPLGDTLYSNSDNQSCSVKDIEVTQAIQRMDHAIPLIKEKQTYARVYVKFSADSVKEGEKLFGTLQIKNTSTNESYYLSSQGFLDVENALDAVKANQKTLLLKRENINHSFNFKLPKSSISGDADIPLTLTLHTLYVEKDGVVKKMGVDVHNGRSVTFKDAPLPMRLRVIGLRYKDPDNKMAHPRQADYDLLKSWLRRAYPVASVEFSKIVSDAQHSLFLPLGKKADEAIVQVAAIRNLDMAYSNIDRRTHYYGMVLDEGLWVNQQGKNVNKTFMRGLAETLPEGVDPATVSAGPAGIPIGHRTWDKDDSYGDWYGAHEIGHTLGRHHVNATGREGGPDSDYPYSICGYIGSDDKQNIGFDVGDSDFNIFPQALPYRKWSDVMSYGENEWLSDYTYKGILERLKAEEKLKKDGTGPDAAIKFEIGAFINVILAKNTGSASGTSQGNQSVEKPNHFAEGLITLPEELGVPFEDIVSLHSEAEMHVRQPEQPHHEAMERVYQILAEVSGLSIEEVAMKLSKAGLSPNSGLSILSMELGLPIEAVLHHYYEIGMHARHSEMPNHEATGLFHQELANMSGLSVGEVATKHEDLGLSGAGSSGTERGDSLAKSAYRFEYINPVPGGFVPTTIPDGNATIKVYITSSEKDESGSPKNRTKDYNVMKRGEFVDAMLKLNLSSNESIQKIEYLENAALQATYRVPENATQIDNVVVVDGSDGARKVSWTSTGGNPFFNVQISRDNGTNWEAVAVGLTINETEIVTNQFEDLSKIKVRVMATNGIKSIFSNGNSLSEPSPTS